MAMGLGFGALAAALAVGLVTGCGSLGYVAQSTSGHLGLAASAKPVSKWLEDDKTPENLRERLALSQRMRDFAVTELGLPDNRSYRSYADLKRPYAVWNVVAAPELSLQLRTWCFPVFGCAGYRGYFTIDEADALGDQLRAEGMEVSV
jgi:predicted aminopeptidase